MFDNWGSVIALVGAILGAYAAILWLGIIVWTYRDIRARTHDTWSQAVAALLVALFNVPGLFLYLILRPQETLSESYERRLETEMIRQEFAEHRRMCPSCQLPVKDEFLICPNCRTTLQEPCLVCNRPLSLEWAVCPYCGNQGPRSTRDARVASVKATIAPPQPPTPERAPASQPAPARAATRPPSPAPERPTPVQQPTTEPAPAPQSAGANASPANRGRRAADRRKSAQPGNPSSTPQAGSTS